MSFQRSKSVPNSIASISSLPVIRSSSHENVQRRTRGLAPPRRAMTDSIVASSTPLLSPALRVDRDDPFNLTSFFPTSRISEEEDGWNWLRETDYGMEDDELAEFVGDSSTIHGDEPAAQVIKNEDKLGVLSLKTLFFAKDSVTNDRLLSPYSDGDVVDVDSLYLALRAGRKAQRGVVESKPSGFGELFLPVDNTERVEEVNSLKGFFNGFRQFLDD